MNNNKTCEICGKDKTYTRPNGRKDWKITETGFMCKSCYGKDYKSRTYVSHRKIPLSGPCVECNSETSYTEKDEYMHWYSGPNGTICK